MMNSNETPFALVPEKALLASLPEHYKKRFETALLLMHDTLTEGLCWEQIAKQSAISPYHFHRQFTLLFNETPGQYLNRLRLQYAVYLLFTAKHKKITDIALLCGYSSSQAMAKALKRELGTTAKNIRQLIHSGTPEKTSELMAKLAHPGNEHSLETQLAKSMPCELVWYPTRGMKKQHFPEFDWDIIFETIGEKSTQLISATPVSELERPWKDISYTIGNWYVPEEDYDHYLPEGYFLCCEVYIVSDVAYIAAIEGLFEQAEKLGYEVDTSGYLIEMVRHVELTLTGGATFAFQIPIIT
ncbi:helix-turn-helix transcriptional regulator [Vibrio albus]|nr:helix-turn-helix transcriptional regulator [Vibrio albus]